MPDQSDVSTPEQAASAIQAIRDRVAQRQQPQPESQQPDLSISQQFTDANDPSYSRHVFSLKGPVSSTQHQTAMNHYNETGHSPEGFTVLQPGMMQKLRSAFETAIGGPARFIGEGKTPVAMLLDKVFGEGTGAKYDPAMGFNKIVSERLSTPETAAATAAQVVTGAATGGMSIPMQAALTAASTGAAYLGAQAATGSPLSLGKAGLEASVAGATQGFTGVVKNLANRSIDTAAANKIETDLVNLAKDQYSHLPIGQYKINSIASTPSGAKAITDVLDKNYHSQIDSITSTINSDINKLLPTALSTGNKNTLRAQIRSMNSSAHSLYESVGDVQGSTIAKRKFNDAVASALDLVKSANPDNLKVQQLVADRLSKSSRLVENMVQNGQVASAMYKSGQGRGFDPVTFQRTVLGMNVTPKSPLEQAGLLMNTPARSSGNIPAATAATATSSAINSFLGDNIGDNIGNNK